ncbi:Dps family protein [Roseibium aggregatum]|uniref:DNA starvation/stationary phase protection protein n=1 Tax=Roseibium aggregatum TaxID=187304 RepID=A0A939EAA7_9HYPH|nr:DNA starvation/stationary phase protection protein [Roseibium aggregatum]MBN9669066.1 DNA starvation/stationary phase protection protein [Roseibium aggregatum]
MTSAAQTNIDTLKKALGETFRLYVQTHGYHWNVEGPNFRQLHNVFEEQYRNLWNALDEIAERIRILGAHAPGSVADLMALAGEEAAPAQSADDMTAKLIDAHEALAATLRDGIAAAGEAGDEVSAGLLTDRLEWHEKELWMMKACKR